MFEKILVPVDGGELSCRAVAYAQALLRPNGKLVLMRAAEGHTFPGGDLGSAEARAVYEAEDAVSKLCENVVAAGTDAEWHVFYGPPGAAICEEVLIVGADTIVMSTHGRSELGKMVLGSVVKHVLHKATVPVLLVPSACRQSWPPATGRRIVVPLDQSTLAEAAIQPAVELARAISAGLLLVGCVPPAYAAYDPELIPRMDFQVELQAMNDYLSAVAERVRQTGTACSALAELAEPVSAIAALADGDSSAAIVMATHGRGGLTRIAMGSVAASVVHSAAVPVLLVRASSAVTAEDLAVAGARSSV